MLINILIIRKSEIWSVLDKGCSWPKKVAIRMTRAFGVVSSEEGATATFMHSLSLNQGYLI